MNQDELKTVLENHRKWRNGEEGGIRADLSGADLSEADLREANLREANLSEADLSEANLREANLSGADLSGAYLRGANLIGADLRGANLIGANLRGASLSGANLRGANWDFSCFPLWCGGSDFKADEKLVFQLLAHICTLKVTGTNFRTIKKLIRPYAKKSHRASDLKLIK